MKILQLEQNHFVESSALYAYGQMKNAARSVYTLDGKARTLVLGQDYGAQLYIDEAAFPNNFGIGWQAPKVAPPSNGVAGYICAGRNRMWNTAVKKPDPIRALKDVLEVLIDFSAEATAAPGGDWNFLIDVMPYLVDPATKDSAPALELSIFPHIGDIGRAWAMGLPAIRKGVVEIGGRKWNVRRAANNCLFFPDPGVDYLTAAIDLKPFYDFLQGAGIADGNMKHVGLQIGVEAVVGGGFLRFNRLSMGAG